MLGTSLGGALLRTRGAGFVAALVVLAVLLVPASSTVLRRRVRGQGAWQGGSAVVLALAAAPIEVAGGLPLGAVLAGALLRTVVFVASFFAVRAALAASAKNGAARRLGFNLAAAALALVGLVVLVVLQRAPESIGAALTLATVLYLAWRRPTAKDLKPVGLSLTGLALLAAFAPFVP